MEEQEVEEQVRCLMVERGWGSERLLEAVAEVARGGPVPRRQVVEVGERARRLMVERGWGSERLLEAAAEVLRSRHLQWQEALFPNSTVTIVIPTYPADQAGIGGRIYNITVASLQIPGIVLNLLVIVPVFVVGLAWGVVMSPVGLLQFVVTEGTFAAIEALVRFPYAVFIWLVSLPVKVCNLLLAAIVFFYGPKH